MARAAWKGEFRAMELWKRLRVANRRGAWVTWARRSSVFQGLVGCDMRVHCGKEFSSALIGQEHIGCKLGSLALSKVIGSNIHRFNRLSQKKKKKSMNWYVSERYVSCVLRKTR